MQRSVIRISGGINDDSETLNINRGGTLKQAIISAHGISFDALNDAAVVTLRLNATSSSVLVTTGTEEFSDELGSIHMSQQLLTSGGGMEGRTIVIPLNERVNIGDKVMLHLQVTGGGTVRAKATLFIQ